MIVPSSIALRITMSKKVWTQHSGHFVTHWPAPAALPESNQGWFASAISKMRPHFQQPTRPPTHFGKVR